MKNYDFKTPACPVCGRKGFELYKLGADGKYSRLVGFECPRCGDVMEE